ncbi:MAG: PD40 domain-containing protein [Planctomycetes bacterium]|nr:PD40 domain-containing protein [Planctomycetota bacterium]
MRLNLTHEVPRLEPLLNDSFGEWGASLSPDGAWLAYANDKTGKARVYIRRYDPLGPPKMVSKTGGLDPQWSRDGSRLYYRKGRPFTLSTFSMRTEVSVIVNPLRCLNRL